MSLRKNLNVFKKTQKKKQKKIQQKKKFLCCDYTIEKEISKTDRDGNEDVVTIP